ncbi:hypothetical protein OAJ07_06890 [Gemmatimonadales bacterium]|nr:hypothetical protein [Gemmatimonadales bacterium]
MRLATRAFGVDFQNPVLLAAGTCGFGVELIDVLDIEALGGFVTKSITVEARAGNPAPRVTEFDSGMMNSVGLANPGLARVRSDKLPWIAANVRRAKVLVSVAGHTVEEYFELIEGLDEADGFVGFEINLSCPNDARRDGVPFALDLDAVTEIIEGCRERTGRPISAKLAPNDPRLPETIKRAEEAGVNAVTLVNTAPGLLLDAGSGQARLGQGAGGVSGPALLPMGIRAVREARAATDLPLLGVGGVLAPADAVAYRRVGADLIQMGTATFAAPRAAEDLISGLVKWGHQHSVLDWSDLGPVADES